MTGHGPDDSGDHNDLELSALAEVVLWIVLVVFVLMAIGWLCTSGGPP